MQKAKERAVSPGPTYMSGDQMTNFLQDLRSNRPTRPIGSRPPPAHFSTWSARIPSKHAELPPVSTSARSTSRDAGVEVDVPPQPVPALKTHRKTTSNKSIDELLAGEKGRALVQPPRGREMTTSSTAQERTPSLQYRESGRRQLEREEARQVRLAMEELELDDESRIYSAARDETAELVWKHRNPNAPGNNPDAPYAYPGLAKKGGHQRSSSVGRNEQDLQRSQSKLRKRSSLGSSTAGSRSSSLQSQRTPSGSSVTAIAGFSTSPRKEDFRENEKTELPTAVPSRKGSDPPDVSKRRRSSGSKRKFSGSIFKDPNDKIYEEPEEEARAPAAAPAEAPAPNPPVADVKPSPLAKLPLQVRRNPFSRVQFARNNSIARSNTDPVIGTKERIDRFEIQKNPPSQSRNAAYTSNSTGLRKPTPEKAKKLDTENEPEIKMKDGKEIRSEEIRAATGFRLRDRSPKLPTPSVVSDSPGRPIVSFQKDWKPKEVELKEEISLSNSDPQPMGPVEQLPRPLSKAATAPAIPTISLPEEPPRNTRPTSAAPIHSISVAPSSNAPTSRTSRAQVPVINIYEDPPARPLPTPSAAKRGNTSQYTTNPVPTINFSQTPPTDSKPSTTPPIPTISISETPTISTSSADRGSSVKPPSISVTPSIPSISINESPASRNNAPAPSISVTPSVPSINVNGPAGSTRPLPTPKHPSGRGVSKPSARNNAMVNQSHWTPTSVRTGALCSHCALPISGRIVSAAGCRFHPECFRCHHCGEHLECVAFYPEPDNKYAERVARIQARMRGEDIEFLPTHPTHEDMMRLEQEDGDESKRFFCHLDYHELFSPRCKSCKTPIEGEVVVACGAEWHVGHFFCAQCGDPFDSTTPFVEKDGYAWCVGCHTNRYSTKCRKCRKPVTDTVVKALGAEWHMGCFCCVECSGPFDDGRYFLRGDSQDPVCVRCEERRLKA